MAAAAPARAADIGDARYDAATDELIVEIIYRGTNPDYDFSVEWGKCSTGEPRRTVGRLIDAQ